MLDKATHSGKREGEIEYPTAMVEESVERLAETKVSERRKRLL